MNEKLRRQENEFCGLMDIALKCPQASSGVDYIPGSEIFEIRLDVWHDLIILITRFSRKE